ncbi:MAG: hypothetical protein HYZ74_04195 [Elusimicrobia bacterium]|nr:hypothetical protein [Elusimicrobiota bacterium]
MIKKLLPATISAALVAGAPGLGGYEVAAAILAPKTIVIGPVGAAPGLLPGVSSLSNSSLSKVISVAPAVNGALGSPLSPVASAGLAAVRAANGPAALLRTGAAPSSAETSAAVALQGDGVKLVRCRAWPRTKLRSTF